MIDSTETGSKGEAGLTAQAALLGSMSAALWPEAAIQGKCFRVSNSPGGAVSAVMHKVILFPS